MVLELMYNENVSDFDFDSNSDSSPDSHTDYDLGLCCWCFAFEELALKVFVVVVEPGEAVDTMVNTEMVVGTGLLPHIDMDNMVEEPYELDTTEHLQLQDSSLLLFSW